MMLIQEDSDRSTLNQPTEQMCGLQQKARALVPTFTYGHGLREWGGLARYAG